MPCVCGCVCHTLRQSHCCWVVGRTDFSLLLVWKIHSFTYLALRWSSGPMGSRLRLFTRSVASSFASSYVIPLLCLFDLHDFLDLPLPLLPSVGIQPGRLLRGHHVTLTYVFSDPSTKINFFDMFGQFLGKPMQMSTLLRCINIGLSNFSCWAVCTVYCLRRLIVCSASLYSVLWQLRKYLNICFVFIWTSIRS